MDRLGAGFEQRLVMILVRCLVVLAASALGLGSSVVACSGGGGDGDGGADSSTESGKDGPAGTPALIELTITSASGEGASPPVALVPAFSPDIHDYYVRCPAATNALTVSMTASRGAESLLLLPETSPSRPKQTLGPIRVEANQAIVAAASVASATVEYWVRCLPPDFPVLAWDPHPEAGTRPPGYYLVGSFYGLTGYAMILDGHGVPVWYQADIRGGVSDVDDVVEGGVSFISTVGGPFVVHDLSPLSETTVAPAGVPLDIHDLQVLPNGDYVAFSSPIQGGVDLTGIHPVLLSDGGTSMPGPGSNIVACNIVEFDPATGAVVWTWSASDHFDPVVDSIEPVLGSGPGDGGIVDGIDVYHCNSIDVDRANGNLLVSARQMSSVFYIDAPTGSVLWKMGGSPSSKDGALYIPVDAPPFTGQHDARLQPGWSTCSGGQISLFDDETYGDAGSARGALYDVRLGAGDGGCDGGTPGASVVWQYRGTASSAASGSFRISADGSRVIGWGIQSDLVFTEVDEEQHDLLDFRFTSANGSYRAIKAPLSAFDLNVLRMNAGLP